MRVSASMTGERWVARERRLSIEKAARECFGANITISIFGFDFVFN